MPDSSPRPLRAFLCHASGDKPAVRELYQKLAADGAYDKRKVYDSLNAHSPEADILIPPRKKARLWQHGNAKAERLKRDENLRSIRKHGRKAWKENSGYHVRSLSETATLAPHCVPCRRPPAR